MLEGVGDGLLRRMGMLLTAVDADFGEDLTAKAVVRDHTADGEGEHLLRTAGAQALGAVAVVATDESGEAGVFLIDLFFTGEDGLFRVDDNDMITVINVRGVGDFVFATQEIGGLDGDGTNNAFVGVNDEPFPGLFFVLGGECFHGRRIECRMGNRPDRSADPRL